MIDLTEESDSLEFNNHSNHKIVQELKEGNKRWVQGTSLVKSQVKVRETLKNHQDPKVVVVTCADSRVVPEYIFDVNIGELFVIRVAGNVVNSEVLGSVEFAIEILNASLVIVLGHQECGAVLAAMDSDDKDFENDSSNLVSIVEKIDTLHDAELKTNIFHNVYTQIEQLKTRSEVISHALNFNTIDFFGMYYSFDTGNISVLNQ